MSNVVWNLGPDPGGQNSPYTVFFDVLKNGTIFVQNTSGFVLKHGFNTIGFAGSFTVNGSGIITGGTISSFKAAIPSEVLIDASGYTIDVNDFNQALNLLKGNQGEPFLLLVFGNPMTVNGSSGPDTVGGGPASDHLYGKAGLDLISGGEGDDFISGGPGVDQIFGDSGSDTADYSDKSAPISVTLNGAIAVPPVQVTVGGIVEDSLTEIENINGGSARDTITGDDLDNRLKGNGGDDILSGREGSDLLEGGEGNDLLQGGTGHNVLRGGPGDDSYAVDDPGDNVVEAPGKGTDLVTASVSFALAANVENLTLAGSADINGTGNAEANTILGNAGANILNGGLGNDTLTGGPGQDHLVFDSALDDLANVDAIVGFSHKDDTIDLDNSIFAKLKKDGVLKGKFFHIGKKAADHNDYLLYSKKTGALSYDADGDRHKIKPIEFTDLDAHAKLTHDDFLVI